MSSNVLTNLSDEALPITGGASDKGEICSQAVFEAVQAVQAAVMPVWPLKDYVAVNPYNGFADKSFLSARKYLRTLSDQELLMPVAYYRQQFLAGAIQRSDISAAVDEMVADGMNGAENIAVNQIVASLKEEAEPHSSSSGEFTKLDNPDRRLRMISEIIDAEQGTHWQQAVSDEISKTCSIHYDNGQAAWRSAWSKLSLFSGWRLTLVHDRRFELLGVTGFRSFVSRLPQHAYAAVEFLLHELEVPPVLWKNYLLCTALATPGWSAWTRYQQRRAEDLDLLNADFVGLLAIRLAYEVALARQENIEIGSTLASAISSPDTDRGAAQTDDLLRYALLRASEIAFRQRLVGQLSERAPIEDRDICCDIRDGRQSKLAQLVFCIDVRSERMRRHIEASSSDVETFGFAGFFGVPMEFIELAANEGSSNVPVLINPQFKVYEELDSVNGESTHSACVRRRQGWSLRMSWKEFQSSTVSMFAFVETTGLLYGWTMLKRSLGWFARKRRRLDGVSKQAQSRVSPSLRGLNQQGVGTTKQTDLAEAILRGTGITEGFARLVVFCGHASEVQNNPLKAGLDCGACGGHSGEPNARIAAKLLNQRSVRQTLVERGIEIPDSTHFVAALHNTTTDSIEFFDEHELPETHRSDLAELRTLCAEAAKGTSQERLPGLKSESRKDLIRRSRDWSEIRPEWGLAGNAAFVAAPRDLTRSLSLDGRVFLHSYDHDSDPGYTILEQIMTAPLVVANWINMQYYASTVDPLHSGSGNKTIHNVVGHFGVLSGSGGDLMTGLPWESVHDGKDFQHHPLRLLALIAAPRSAIESILAQHEHVNALASNGWIQLLVIDDDACYRFTEQQTWEELPDSLGALRPC